MCNIIHIISTRHFSCVIHSHLKSSGVNCEIMKLNFKMCFIIRISGFNSFFFIKSTFKEYYLSCPQARTQSFVIWKKCQYWVYIFFKWNAPLFSSLLLWLLSLFRTAQRPELRVDLNMRCTVASSANSLFLVVSCSWFSETEFQVKEVLNFCLLWALVQVLSQGKSPCQLSGSQSVAVILFAELPTASLLAKFSHTSCGCPVWAFVCV